MLVEVQVRLQVPVQALRSLRVRQARVHRASPVRAKQESRDGLPQRQAEPQPGQAAVRLASRAPCDGSPAISASRQCAP